MGDWGRDRIRVPCAVTTAGGYNWMMSSTGPALWPSPPARTRAVTASGIASSEAGGVSGVVLAADLRAETGRPASLASDREGPWLPRAVNTLLAAGCDPVFVVLGAASEEAAELVPPDPRVRTIVSGDWQRGQSYSLRTGLRMAAITRSRGMLLTRVELPNLQTAAAQRIMAGTGEGTLRRAVYDGRPGYPLYIGRKHWTDLRLGLSGEVGAQDFLEQHAGEDVDCSDLGGGTEPGAPG